MPVRPKTTKSIHQAVIFAVLLLVLLLVLLIISPASAQQQNLDSSDVILAIRGADTSSHLGTVLAPLGDLNHDGFADIAVSTVDPVGSYIYYGGNPADTIPDGFLFQSLKLSPPLDMVGDGIRDFAGSTVHQIPEPPYIRGTLYFYKGFEDSVSSFPIDSIHPDSSRGFGGHFDCAYVDGDSLADFIVSDPNVSPGPRFYYYSGPFAGDKLPDWQYVIQGYSHAAAAAGFVDFNGDGWEDIYLGLPAELDTSGIVEVFFGPYFGSSPDLTLRPHFDSLLDPKYFALRGAYNIADANGDGWEDLCVLWSTAAFVYCGGPSADSVFDYRLYAPHEKVANIGDVNGDGFADIAGGGGGRFFDGSVELYLGGDEFDIMFDDYMRDSDLPPWFLNRIGIDVASAGDFNGDGIDDFMFSAKNFAFGYRGSAFVIGGTGDIVTPVGEDTDPLIPDIVTLQQNYPNPFNPETVIRFSLDRAAHVRLRIVNLLGQTVGTLIDQHLPAGEHETVWNGRSSSGTQAASGVYFYELSSEDWSLSRKMVLIR